jgi:UDP-glucose 4-epimerase
MILVTGGAGYIGSQVVRQLLKAKEEVVVLDSLITGYQEALPQCPFVQGDVGDAQVLMKLFQIYPIKSVMHFAASTVVPESVNHPLKYYENNTINTYHLLKACVAHQVKQFVFSSTAAVYGIPQTNPVKESMICQPINPYGYSKLMSEQILKDVAARSDLRFIALRYFNVAGADPSGELGPYKKESTLLMRVVAQAALGVRDKVTVFGDQFPTPDGTGIRDFIHITDIARAHIDALHYLASHKESHILNCGYGHGFSVKEVIAKFEEVVGHNIPVEITKARKGDPAEVVADASQIRSILHWTPEYDNLDQMVIDTLRWAKKLFQCD